MAKLINDAIESIREERLIEIDPQSSLGYRFSLENQLLPLLFCDFEGVMRVGDAREAKKDLTKLNVHHFIELLSQSPSKLKRTDSLFTLDCIELASKHVGPEIAKKFRELRNTMFWFDPLENRIRECVMTALREKGIDYVKYLTAFEKSTRIIVTDGGRLGLAPSMSKPGDVVAIIKGARAPFILRPNQCGSVFKIVGQVYIRGLMFGEALETKGFNFKDIEIT
jgi:hypothetical protein